VNAVSTLEFFLVRHGESTWNAERRWQGRSDPPLSPLGCSQASAAGERLWALGGVDLIVTSTLQRARRSGELMSSVAGTPLDPAVEALSERSAGAWEGLKRSEIEQRYPGYLASDRRPLGYEPDASIVRRASGAIVDLAARRPAQRVVVVSHGGVIHALERHVGVSGDPWTRVGNLEGRWFEFDGTTLRALGGRVGLLTDDPVRSNTAAEDA
jgi:broad specificity phosphatase PhoE